VNARLVVRSAAEADIAAAALWYEDRAPGLGADFLRAVDVALAEVARAPERFPVVHRQCHRALLRRFPYAVYFVWDSGVVSVIACLHVRRDPQTWERRVSEQAAAIAGEG
jgi:plasmid stabilization system protein ParE